MEYCKKCGAKIETSTGCCVNCGLHVNDYSKIKSNVGLKIILLIFLMIAILLGAKVVMNMVEAKADVAPDSGYLEVVDEIVDAVYVKKDMEAYVSLMPESMLQATIDGNFAGDEAAFQENIQEVNAYLQDMVADEGSIAWNINEEIDMVGVMLNQLEDQFEEEMGIDIKIRAAKALDITVSYTQNGEAKQENMYMIIGMVDGEWCVLKYS